MKQKVTVYELQSYDEDLTTEGLQLLFTGSQPAGKIMLDRSRWDAVERYLQIEFNQRLKSTYPNTRSQRWKRGRNYVHRLFGKEMMVLCWAVEECNPADVQHAVENWLGLRPEERWWLYTVTNAATGHPINHRGRGWRKALRFALTENPIAEGRYTQPLLDGEKMMLFEEEQKFGSPS